MYIKLEAKKLVVEKHYFSIDNLTSLLDLEKKLYSRPHITYNEICLVDDQFNYVGEIDQIDVEFYIESLISERQEPEKL